MPKETIMKLDDAMKFLLDIFENVRKETEDGEGERVYILGEHYSNWIDMWKYFDSLLDKGTSTESLLSFRLMEINKTLLWLWFSCTSGAYHPAIRELRYTFESFIQAYYIDNEHPDATIQCKLEIIKEIDRIVGGSLIKKTDLGYKKQLKDLYRDLCKYTHPSYEELKPVIQEGIVGPRVTFTYNKELFDKCIELTDKTIDAIIFIFFNYDGGMLNKIKSDKITLNSLSNIDDSLVYHYLNAKNKK